MTTPTKGKPMTMHELLKDVIAGRPIYNYSIHSPISLDDPAVISVVIVYGNHSDWPDKVVTERHNIRLVHFPVTG